VLDALWLLPIGGLAIWGLWAGNGLLTLATSLALLVSLSLVVWQRYSLAGVSCSWRMSEHRAFFGHRVELVLEILNVKPLPLTWLRVEENVPRNLEIQGGAVFPGRSDFTRYLVNVLPMLPYERVVRRFQVLCTRRGEHTFGPSHLESGDYLGIRRSYGGVSGTHRLLVFPKVFPVVLGRVASNQIVGREAVRRILLTDPIRTIGVREYAPGDPHRIIEWRASARAGSLMVRVFEPSTTPALDIVLNFSVPATGPNQYEPDELEFLISIGASLARYGVERRWAVGVRGNGRSGSGPIAVPPAAGPGQLGEVLNALARAGTMPTRPLLPLLTERDRRVPAGASLVLVTAELDEDVLAAALDLRRRGRPVTVIHTGAGTEPPFDGPIPIWRAPYDEHWTDREALVLGA
jgi:uncharacterized protein (DUF58 family)